MLSVLEVIKYGTNNYQSRLEAKLPTQPPAPSGFLPAITKALKELQDTRVEFYKNAALSVFTGCIAYFCSSSIIKTSFVFQACFIGLAAGHMLCKIKKKVIFINHTEKLVSTTVPLFIANSPEAFWTAKNLGNKIVPYTYESKKYTIWADPQNVYLTPVSSFR